VSKRKLDIKRVSHLTIAQVFLLVSPYCAYGRDNAGSDLMSATAGSSGAYDYLPADEKPEKKRKGQKEQKEGQHKPQQIDQSSQHQPGQTPLLKGEVNYVVPSGTPLKLQLATVPTHAVHMMDRDLDGHLLPAKVGNEITAKVTEDLYVDDNKVIPEGTVFHGKVSQIMPPRRVGRPGSLVISFDQLTTPDGRKFAFRAEADNVKPSTAKTKAKGFGIIMAYAGGGAVVGALVAYEICGLHNTIAMHGYNIAGGAAAGALLASGYAIMRHGPVATLEPGDELHLQIDRDLLMPVAEEPAVKASVKYLPGLQVDIEKGRLVSDGLDGHILIVDAVVHNESEKDLSSIDIFLEDSNGNRSPLISSPDNDDDVEMLLFTVKPHELHDMHLAFQIEYPKLKRQLVWLDHETHVVCYRQKLP
jgi:hypothetical protein